MYSVLRRAAVSYQYDTYLNDEQVRKVDGASGHRDGDLALTGLPWGRALLEGQRRGGSPFVAYDRAHRLNLPSPCGTAVAAEPATPRVTRLDTSAQQQM